ncbi:MAG TPA: hypothetical protein VKU00_17140 [Chthonomonadaceae bacterium]|nr:hypothetical protein [Chthonomonadaceae bacterium]
MQSIETASWVETQTRWEKTFGEHTLSSQHWLRTNPPTEASYIDFGDSWSHDVTDERGHLHTASTWKICQFFPHQRPYDALSLQRRVLFAPPQRDGSSLRPDRNWRHDQVEHEGRAVNQWFREYVQDNFRVTETLWTELQTHRILRKECRQTDPRTGRLIAVDVCDRYVYNEKPPSGIFEMPPGKRLVTHKDTMPEVWETLPARDQQAIQATINRSDKAWCSSDSLAFASVWEFDFVRLASRQAEWQQRVEEQKGLWSHWTSVVQTARTQQFVPVTVARHTFKWGPEKRKVLRVHVKVHVASNRGAKEWTGDAEFYLRRKGRGYRIVHWECPWEEIRDAVRAERASIAD